MNDFILKTTVIKRNNANKVASMECYFTNHLFKFSQALPVS